MMDPVVEPARVEPAVENPPAVDVLECLPRSAPRTSPRKSLRSPAGPGSESCMFIVTNRTFMDGRVGVGAGAGPYSASRLGERPAGMRQEGRREAGAAFALRVIDLSLLNSCLGAFSLRCGCRAAWERVDSERERELGEDGTLTSVAGTIRCDTGDAAPAVPLDGLSVVAIDEFRPSGSSTVRTDIAGTKRCSQVERGRIYASDDRLPPPD